MKSKLSVSAEVSTSAAEVGKARAVVEDIAALNGVFTDALRKRAEGDQDIKRLLESNRNLKTVASNATHRLAEDLNAAPTHFVLECIQNADDNDYADGVEPFLRLSVSPHQIQLDCNEKGFKEDHVRAICSVGKSTKAKQKTTEGRIGYIGEKGIGFKSVFKIAEQVYICSPPYSFKFDKRNELGMITPLWVPEEKVLSTLREDSQTAIVLSPNSQETYNSRLLKDFVSIPSTLLLFLRKLKMLEMVITNLPTEAGPTRIHKILTSSIPESRRIAILTERDVVTKNVVEDKYYLFEQTRQTALAVEEKRRIGVEKTELALAFPVDPFGKPRSSTQPVHAFLPIRDYGFKFLIQADFIVTSSREEVDKELLWNIALRDYIAYVFKDAIEDFVNSPNHDLRYTWMRFLPKITDHRAIPPPFFNPVKESVHQLMTWSRVLESRAGTLHCPTELYLLSHEIMDRFGIPIVGADSSCLSKFYDDKDAVILKDIGLKTWSWDWVLEQLCQLGDAIRSKFTSAWTNWESRIKQLPLIPLHGGGWTPATQLLTDPIYFRRDSRMADVPADINLRLVDSDCSANPNREALFRLLGVKDCNKREVAESVLRKHQDSSTPSKKDSIAHVNYLFALDPSICDKLDMKSLWFYDEEGQPARGCDLYIRSSDVSKYSAASLLGSDTFHARFLSNSYGSLDEINGQQTISHSMQRWLMSRTEITDIPRLAKFGSVSRDFKYILDQFPNDVPYILRAHWNAYKHIIEKVPSVKNMISSHEVRTFDGVSFMRWKLKDTFAPDPILKKASSDLCSEGKGVYFLDIDSYESSDWEFLKVFGVGFEANLTFYGWVVKQPQFRSLCNLSRFKDLLQKMAMLASVDLDRKQYIRTIFLEDNVFIPNNTGGEWIKSKNCVWDAPSGFKKQSSIKQWYDDHDVARNLLQSILRIEDATAQTLIEDLASTRPSDEYLKASSAYLVAKLKNSKDDSVLAKVRKVFENHPLLPISGDTSRRVKSVSCYWGNPDFEGPRLSSKHDLQREYRDDVMMSALCKSILKLLTPSWDDMINEIELMKGRDVIAKNIENIYGFMFYGFKKDHWKLMRTIFDRRTLVFVQSSSGGSWKRPSECVWKTPINLRSRSALNEQYISSDVHAQNFLQKALSIEDAGVAEYIADLEILSATNCYHRDDVENLYKHIELSIWNRVGCSFGSKDSNRLILNHEQRKWVSLDDCVWYGPECVKLTTKLASLYPGSKKLFSEYLGVGNYTQTTITRELAGLHTPDPDNISANVLKSLKTLLFVLKNITATQGLSQTAKSFLKTQRVWPRQYIGSEKTALVNIEQPFFVPDHPLLLTLLEAKKSCDFPILNVRFEEISKIKPLLVALGLGSRSLSLSKSESVSATDMSDPADHLTDDLRKRAQALFFCAVHYETKRKLEKDDLLKKLNDIRVYRTPNISTEYQIDSQGIKTTIMALGYLRVAEEDGEIRVFVPEDEILRKTGYSNCLASEMIQILQIPEDKSWQAVSALLTSEADVEQLALILSLHGIHHTLKLQRQEKTKQTISVESVDEEECEDSGNVEITSLASAEDKSVSTTRRPPSNPSFTLREGVGQVQAPEQIHSSLHGIPDHQVTLELDALKAPVPPEDVTFESSHNSSRRSPEHLAATRSRLVAAASASARSAFTVAPKSRDARIAAGPTAAFDLSNMAMALPHTPPRTPSRNSGVANNQSSLSSSPPTRTVSTTPPSWPGGSLSTPRNNSNRYEGIDLIGWAGEQYVVEVLKRHLPDFQEATHWTSKLRAYSGIAPYGSAEETDLTYPDTKGHLSKFILDCAEEGSVPDWLEATRVPGAKGPTYFLEVKTTPGACEKPFFISPHQFDIMERKAVLTGRDIPHEVYVILRVYDINGQPKIKVYIDPWTSKGQRGGLQFTIHEYSVTPI